MEYKHIMDQALEEVHGAKAYAKCAMKYREEDPMKAKKYFDLAQEELRHGDMLYKMAEEEKRGERTAMEREYMNADRERYAEKLSHVKAMLDAFRGA